jgi:C4-dicarboxylate transporter DctM subunit
MTLTAPSPAVAPQRGRPKAATMVLFGGLALAAFAAILLLFSDQLGLPKQTIGGLVVLLAAVLFLVGVPVGIAMLGASLLGLFSLGGVRVIESTLSQVAYDTSASWSYSVIPMFILMGTLLWKSGLAKSAFAAARDWVGWVPGGLAVATNFTGAMLAAGSGSTIGITHALGRIAIPEMLRAGYRPSLAVGTVAAAGTLGQIIPPSLLLVVYAGAAGVAVGPQLLAGVIPGIMLALAFALMIIIRCSIDKELAPRIPGRGIGWGGRFRSLLGIVPIVVIIAIVIGGMFLGIFTATEAGVFGALAALIIGTASVLRRERSGKALWKMLKESTIATLTGTASIFLLLIGVFALTRVVALSQIANALAAWVVDLGLGRIGFLLVLVVIYIILGMFMDTLAMMLLTIPVLMVPLAEVGVDPIFFGVFLVIMAEIGLLTPPLGILSFVVHRIAADPEVNLGRKVSLGEVFKGATWFVVAALVIVVVLILLPDIVTWLPGLGVQA